EAKAKVQAWLDRHKPSRPKNTGDDQPSSVSSVSGQTPRLDTPDGTAQTDPPEDPGNAVEPDPPEDSGTSTTTIPPETPGTPVAQLQKRLGLIMPTRR
ncbi:MAG: hypothetical protein RR843_04750, partial [Clostridia bacterium]